LRTYGLADHEFVAALEMIVAQRLIRKLCPHCRRQGVPSDAEKAWLARLGYPDPAETWQAVGCAECQQTGYLGRTGVFEVWRLDARRLKQSWLMWMKLRCGAAPALVCWTTPWKKPRKESPPWQKFKP
jgi:type II secretory ATPase GspE/PulE/Tfp pilus assembly ATPase PilB-like protein